MGEAQKATADINEARLMIVPPPLIQGIGSAGGYRLMVEDLGDQGYDALGKQAFGVIGKDNQTAGLQQIYTFFNTATQRIFADNARRTADRHGVPPSQEWENSRVGKECGRK